MLRGNLTDEQMEMLSILVDRGSCDSLKHICNGITLTNYQTLLTAWILITRKFICTLDTGLGKTVIASAVIKWLWNSGESKNFIYVCENAGMNQTANKIANYTGLNVITCDASIAGAELISTKTPEDYQILVISYQALQSYELAKYLVMYHWCFNTIIYDECQWLSELHNSNTWEITKCMRKNFRDVVMFSATPFKTNPLQMLKQVELLDSSIIGNINAYIEDKCTRSKMYEIVDWYNLDKIKEDLTLYVNGFTRKELNIDINYKPFAHLCEPLEEQTLIEPHNMHRIKSYNADNLTKLKDIIFDYVMDIKKGIIYCSTNENKMLLKKTLEEMDISYGIIDGTLSDKNKRFEIQSRYIDGEISVLIINVTTTLDLPSDYCIFYELCDAGTVTQFIGRCIRGLDSSELDVHFILTKDTYEIKYFYNSIWKKSKYLQDTLGKDNIVMNEIKKLVDNKMCQS